MAVIGYRVVEVDVLSIIKIVIISKVFI